MRKTIIRAMTSTLAVTAFVATIGVVAVPKAEAGIWTYDFATWANGKEGAYSANPLSATNSGLPDAGVVDPLLAAAGALDDASAPGVGSYTGAGGTSPANPGGTGVSPYAYLDAPSGGPGGLGVCSSTNCSGNNDDNINYGEILTLTFIDADGAGVQITDLQFSPTYLSNGDHHNLNADIMISIDGAAFSTYNVSNGLLGDTLNGTTFAFKTAGSSYSVAGSFYLSYAQIRTGGDKTDLPEAASLGLFGLGLVGIGFAARRRRLGK